MFHNRNAFATARTFGTRNPAAALCPLTETERADVQRALSDWTARFNAKRNPMCEGQKNFRGIGQVA